MAMSYDPHHYETLRCSHSGCTRFLELTVTDESRPFLDTEKAAAEGWGWVAGHGWMCGEHFSLNVIPPRTTDTIPALRERIKALEERLTALEQRHEALCQAVFQPGEY
jgi:hypothetical protein